MLSQGEGVGGQGVVLSRQGCPAGGPAREQEESHIDKVAKL